MADAESKWPDNAPGKFYVDDQCLGCDACRTVAPEIFARHKKGYAYVARQPETDAEVRLCYQAIAGCCTEAIGTDGDENPDAFPDANAPTPQSQAEGESANPGWWKFWKK